jgi:hypothetical protein
MRRSGASIRTMHIMAKEQTQYGNMIIVYSEYKVYCWSSECSNRLFLCCMVTMAVLVMATITLLLLVTVTVALASTSVAMLAALQ